MIFQNELIKSLYTNGDKIAIEDSNHTISYADLLDTANKVTRFLLKKELHPQTLVGVLLDGKSHMICSAIGIMNARCIFVPIDGALPAIRIIEMIRDLNLTQLITSRSQAGNLFTLNNPAVNQLYLEEILDQANEDDGLYMKYPEYAADDSLYIYFTSGSSGKPKGIVGKNCSLLQFLKWEIETFDIGSESRFSQFITPYFDAFLRDVFVPLLAGGTVCLAPEEEDFLTGEKLIKWIDVHRINFIHCVPSLFRIINSTALSPENFKQLLYVLLSGEKIIPSELLGWYKIFGSRIQLVNFYGATETTMIRAYYAIQPEDAGQARIPIGSPIYDTELLITKDGIKSCGLLVPGDLYIVSNFTTKGYLNAPELTHEKFIRLPEGTGGRIAFKTGDTARMIAGKKIELLGRKDRQIKLRGIRIELDEIEKYIVQSGFIRNTVVTKQTGEGGNEYLVAFVIKSEQLDGHFPLQEETKQYLKQYLPAYMIPAKIIEVSEFPLLNNGKIDHRKLLDIQVQTIVLAPVNETEERLLAIWNEILGDKPISTEDSFHTIGGNSISMMRLIGKIYKEFAVRLSLNDLFNNLTIKTQAVHIRLQSKDRLMLLSKVEEKPGYALSAAQERMYYNYELNKNSTAFNLPMAWKMDKEIDIDKLKSSLRVLIDRHESLRTEFRFINGRLLQVVRDKVDFSIEEVDARDQDVQDCINRFIRPFDLSNAPLMRCGIVNTAYERILVMDVHHIVCDGMSQMILLSDFLSLYRDEQMRPLAFQYKDYAEWEHHFRISEEYIAHREFWLKSFEGDIPMLELPLVNMGKKRTVNKGGNVFFEIDHLTLTPVLKFLREEEITSFSGLFSLFFMFLSQLSGQDDIVVGTNTSGRMQDELEGVVGMFVKTIPVRYKIEIKAAFKSFVKNMHKYLIQANSRQIYDLADILSELNANRSMPVKSLFEVMFVYQNFPGTGSRAETNFLIHDFENTTAKYPITLFVTEDTDSFNFRLEYATDYFTKQDIELLVSQFKSLIKKVSENMDSTTDDLIGILESSPQLAEDEISFNFL
jgi:amino acid adenylation domain-containing protein